MATFRSKITLAIQGIIDTRYTAYSRRIRYGCDTFQGAVDGLEIGFFTDQAGAIENALDDTLVRKKLNGFGHNSIHVAARVDCPVRKPDIDKIMELCNALFYGRVIQSISFHLDLSRFFQYISYVAAPGLPLMWENLGKDSPFSNTYKELVAAVQSFPDWGIVFDIAHVLEMESCGQPSLGQYFETLGDRIKQIHFSWPGNLYSESQVGPDFKTSHSLVHLQRTNAAKIRSVLKNLHAEVITIEGVIPPGDLGEKLVIKEIEFIKSSFSSNI